MPSQAAKAVWRSGRASVRCAVNVRANGNVRTSLDSHAGSHATAQMGAPVLQRCTSLLLSSSCGEDGDGNAATQE